MQPHSDGALMVSDKALWNWQIRHLQYAFHLTSSLTIYQTEICSHNNILCPFQSESRRLKWFGSSAIDLVNIQTEIHTNWSLLSAKEKIYEERSRKMWWDKSRVRGRGEGRTIPWNREKKKQRWFPSSRELIKSISWTCLPAGAVPESRGEWESVCFNLFARLPVMLFENTHREWMKCIHGDLGCKMRYHHQDEERVFLQNEYHFGWKKRYYLNKPHPLLSSRSTDCEWWTSFYYLEVSSAAIFSLMHRCIVGAHFLRSVFVFSFPYAHCCLTPDSSVER